MQFRWYAFVVGARHTSPLPPATAFAESNYPKRNATIRRHPHAYPLTSRRRGHSMSALHCYLPVARTWSVPASSAAPCRFLPVARTWSVPASSAAPCRFLPVARTWSVRASSTAPCRFLPVARTFCPCVLCRAVPFPPGGTDILSVRPLPRRAVSHRSRFTPTPAANPYHQKRPNQRNHKNQTHHSSDSSIATNRVRVSDAVAFVLGD